MAVVSAAGTHLYVANKWGILQVLLTNPSGEPVRMQATTYFIDEPTLQYGRQVWVPAKARMQTWHPILIPAAVSQEGRRANFRTMVSNADKPDVLIRSESGQLQFGGTLRVAKTTPVTGIIDIRRNTQEEEEIAPVELLIAAQTAEHVTRQNTYLVDDIFAPGEESLNALDQLVMVEGRIAADEAGFEAIRRWLYGGGHLWVMLERVDARVLELILGDEFNCEVIDRVALTSVRIESAEQDTSRRSNQTYERPVDFVRVAVSDVDVAYTVDGWPAAFWKQCGDGSLLVTTLGARGWMRSRTDADNVPAPPVNAPGGPAGPLGIRGPEPPREPAADKEKAAAPEKYALLNSMKGLAARFFSSRPAPLLSDAMLAQQVEEYVGYTIPPRWMIVSLLSGLSLVIAGLGSVLWRGARPEKLGWAGPGLAAGISLVLVLLGRHYRHAIPATVASLQFVQPVPGTDDVRVHGIDGLFSPEGGTSEIKAEHGGWLMPEMTGLEGSARRMVWTDLDEWHWENLPELAGLRSSRFSASAATGQRVEARATFGPEGVEGHVQVGPGHLASDAVLATRDGRIGVQIGNDGAFVARKNDVFATGQFLAGALWTDEQNRHARIFELLLTSPQRQDYPATPQLLLWTNPWDLGFRFETGRNSLGAALLSVPLQWERPPSGARVVVPASLLSYRATTGPDGLVPSGLWDYRKRRWQEKSGPSATWLRFRLPQVLLPLQIERAVVELEVTGPVGKLEIAGLRMNPSGQHDTVPFKTWIDPWGKLTLEITQSELLPISADGGLLLRVSGGDPERPELTHPDPENSSKTIPWRIESLSLELHGKTTEASVTSAHPHEKND
jgi:hypothetical protein